MWYNADIHYDMFWWEAKYTKTIITIFTTLLTDVNVAKKQSKSNNVKNAAKKTVKSRQLGFKSIFLKSQNESNKNIQINKKRNIVRIKWISREVMDLIERKLVEFLFLGGIDENVPPFRSSFVFAKLKLALI